MDITIGNLIDQLVVCNLKIWHLEDLKVDFKDDDAVVAEATRKTSVLNRQRNRLIEEIDLMANKIAKGEQQLIFGQGSTKMYGNRK